MTALEWLKEFWQQTPGPIRTFAIAVPSALFGAWLSGRAQARRLIIDEIRALNVAHALCFIIANKAISFKRQHVRAIKSAYDAATEAHDAFMLNPVQPFTIQMDFKTLSPTTFPSSALEKLVCEKLFIGGEGVSTAISLSGAIDDLKETLKFRNDIISEFRKDADAVNKRVAKYLGLVDGDVVDDRFRNNVEALSAQTDDCIFFAQRLSRIIVRFENKLRRRKWHFFLPGRKLIEPSWKLAEDEGLIPSEDDYANWTRGFVKRSSMFQRVKSLIARKIVRRDRILAP